MCIVDFDEIIWEALPAHILDDVDTIDRCSMLVEVNPGAASPAGGAGPRKPGDEGRAAYLCL